MSVLIIILFLYIYFLKKEVKNITTQLKDYNGRKTEKKIEISLGNKEIEDLAEAINNELEISRNERVKEIKRQEQLKELISNISHDLRTPLTSIAGYIKLLKGKKLSVEKENRYIEVIERRVENLQELLNSFFMLSIVDSKDYEIDLEEVDLKEIFCEVLGDFYDDFNKISLEPEITIDNDKMFCLGNKKALRRIIENLISNLLKYSKSNPIIKLEKENQRAVITIINETDNISKLDVEKFFDKFYREDKARDFSEKSTGLGLSVVKVLVEKLNGEIWAEKEEEKIIIKFKLKII